MLAGEPTAAPQLLQILSKQDPSPQHHAGACHSHAPVGGPQVHRRKVDHGQVVVGHKVLPRLGSPVCIGGWDGEAEQLAG